MIWGAHPYFWKHPYQSPKTPATQIFPSSNRWTPESHFLQQDQGKRPQLSQCSIPRKVTVYFPKKGKAGSVSQFLKHFSGGYVIYFWGWCISGLEYFHVFQTLT